MAKIVFLYDACLHKNYVISIMNFIFEVDVNATDCNRTFRFHAGIDFRLKNRDLCESSRR